MRMSGGDNVLASFSSVDGSISTNEGIPMVESRGESLGPGWCQLVDTSRRSESEGFRGKVPGGCLSAAACPHCIPSFTRRICFDAFIKTTKRASSIGLSIPAAS